MLQLIRSSTHLLVQLLFPRTHVRLRGVLQMSNSSWFTRTAHDSSNRARNPSFRDDQLHTAHPHVHNVQSASINCVDGGIANVYNLQTRNNKPLQIYDNTSCIILQNWAHTPRLVNGIIMSNRKWQHACRTKFVHTCKNDHVGRFLNHAHTHVDNNTVVAKTPGLSQKQTGKIHDSSKREKLKEWQ